MSQDWDAHAGIGKHKDERFLQGEVDEFRIYNKALSQGEIQNLTKACSFERGECFCYYWYLFRVTVVIASAILVLFLFSLLLLPLLPF